MSKKKHKQKHKHKPAASGPARSVTFQCSVLQSIRQHARRSPQAEICGALIGRQTDGGTLVIGAVPGEGAAQGGAHVTFTQEAWIRIHEEKDRKFSGQAIVGWYHSHPGFGVFLSDHDTFIHKHFFSEPGSLAWVYDPHSDEEGCFGWNGGEVRRLERYGVVTEVSQNAPPKVLPSPVSQGHRSARGWRWSVAVFRSSKLVRALIVAAAAILLAVLFQALRKHSQQSSTPEQTNRPAENLQSGQKPATHKNTSPSDHGHAARGTERKQ